MHGPRRHHRHHLAHPSPQATVALRDSRQPPPLAGRRANGDLDRRRSRRGGTPARRRTRLGFRLFELAGDAAAPPPLALAASAGEPAATASLAVSVTIASESGATPENRTSTGGIVMAAYGSGAASMAHPELAEMVVMELATHSLQRGDSRKAMCHRKKLYIQKSLELLDSAGGFGSTVA